MKIEVHAPGGPDLTIPLPNELLFSPALWSGLLKFSNHGEMRLPEFSPETANRACKVIQDYTRKVGSWELVRVESSGGATVIITV